jgi:RNA polymerase-interacting CarD/CdnL/TRCF family regulator
LADRHRISDVKEDGVVFKVGQKVIYPNHGVAIVEQIDMRDIDGRKDEFYLLRLHFNNSLVMVPTRNADEIGLRRIAQITGAGFFDATIRVEEPIS